MTMADHVCACSWCDPSLGMAAPSPSEKDRIYVRFWDDESEEDERKRAGVILLDGEPVPGAFEALLGDPGTVWAYERDPGLHICRACSERARDDGTLSSDGTVTVTFGPEGRVVHTPLVRCMSRRRGRVELKMLSKDDRSV